MEITFPLEFLVEGVPASSQAARGASRDAWKTKVSQACHAVLPEGHFLTPPTTPIAVTLYCFPDGRLQGDVDNIPKLVLDAMSQHIYEDDRQVERVVVQKFEQGRRYAFENPSPLLALAMARESPVLYVKVTDDPHEELT
jgi:Holliday junction resolvase RusA-like endonuclease